MKAKLFFYTSAFLLTGYTAACTDKKTSSSNEANTDTTQLPPVETKAANTNYKPAFAGQTRIGAVKTTTAYKVEKLADRIGRPWAITPMPDGRLLITDKRDGFLQILTAMECW